MIFDFSRKKEFPTIGSIVTVNHHSYGRTGRGKAEIIHQVKDPIFGVHFKVRMLSDSYEFWPYKDEIEELVNPFANNTPIRS